MSDPDRDPFVISDRTSKVLLAIFLILLFAVIVSMIWAPIFVYTQRATQ